MDAVRAVDDRLGANLMLDQPWLRQPRETDRQFHAFSHYRDLQPHASLDAAYREHATKCLGQTSAEVSSKRRPANWLDWSVHFAWVTRRDLWLDELDRQKRVAFVKEQKDAAARHARIAQAMLSAASLPVRELLARVGTPQFEAELKAMRVPGLLATVGRLGYLVPSLINAERLSLGLSTASLEIDERQQDILKERALFTEQVLNDPAATDLAIALLDRVAPSSLPAREKTPEVAEVLPAAFEPEL